MPFISYTYICHPCICFLSAYFSSLDVFVFQPSYFHFNFHFPLICLCTLMHEAMNKIHISC
jgi:hypothetical protein